MDPNDHVAFLIAGHEAGRTAIDLQWHSWVIRVLPLVFSPALAESSVFFADHLLQLKLSDRTVVDAGCGSGILGIACALAGARRIFAFDRSSLAIENAKQNVQRLGLTDRFDLSVAVDWQSRISQCNLVVCNPPFFDRLPELEWHRLFLDPYRVFLKAVLHNAWRCLLPDGRLIIACADGALPSSSVSQLMRDSGFQQIIRERKPTASLLRVSLVSGSKPPTT